MAEPHKPGPVRKLFQDLKNQSAGQGYHVGLMESALYALEIVRDDARENLKRVPNHKLSAEAERVLTRAIDQIRDLATNLNRIASGGAADG